MKLKLSISLFVMSVLLASCLKSKDTTGLLGNDEGVTITEITDVSYNNLYGQDQVLAMNAEPATETVTAFTLKYQAGKKPPAADLKVKVTASGSGLPAGFVALPAANYTIPAEITIPRSTERTVEFPITINKTGLDLSKKYALTFTISSVSEGVISELGKEITVQFIIKNKYDGVYTVTGSLVDANGVYTGIYPNAKVQLRTVSANAVDYLDPTYSVGPPFANNAYIIKNISSGAPAWLYSPRFVFNTTTDKATSIIDNYDGSVYGIIDPSGPNQFTVNGSTKTFNIKYTTNGGRFTITETWTYTGPRP
jgi:hypothetical protein